ncbi:MAG: hypothetical protein AB8B77_00750 [Alphaproteobacteria bacterium]
MSDFIAHSLKAAKLQNRGDLAPAMIHYQAAHRAEPLNLSGLFNVISCAYHLGDWKLHKLYMDKAAAIAPDHPNLSYVNANYLLLKGDYAAGFAAYEARMKTGYMAGQKIIKWREKLAAIPELTANMLHSGALEHKSVLILTEQGHGDIMMFLRFLPMLASHGFQISFLNFKPALIPLLEQQDLPCHLLKIGDEITPPAAHASLLSLAHILSLETPRAVPPPFSFKPSLAAIDKFQTRKDIRKIGLVASGQTQNYWNNLRALPLEKLANAVRAALSPAPHIKLVHLQYQPRESDQEFLNHADWIEDWGASITNFDDAAGAIYDLDLIITIDTATAHLAASMGKPCFIMLPFVPDWRWGIGGLGGLEQTHSSWYPEARLFRQKQLDDWDSALAQLTQSLQNFFE